MGIAKAILAVLGGLLIGLYFTGHDLVGTAGLPFSKQVLAGGLALLLAVVMHILGGEDL